MNSKEFFDNYWEQEGDKAINKLADKKYEDDDDEKDNLHDNSFTFTKRDWNVIHDCIYSLELKLIKLKKEYNRYVILKGIAGVIEAGILLYILHKTKGL